MDAARQLSEGEPPQQLRSPDRLRLLLLAIWATASFGVCWFARDLAHVILGWPFNFWFAAQGAVLVFLEIVIIYATIRNRRDRSAHRNEEP